MAGFTEYEGKPYYRMLQPLALKPTCYKCHAYAGYRLDEIVGGLGVHVDLAVYSELKRDTIFNHVRSYLVVWVFGTLGILLAGRRWGFYLQEREALHRQLEEMTTHDPLTGFLNRHQLGPIFRNELARARRDHTPFSILMVDVDHFKGINDSYSHPTGDAILHQAGTLIASCLRETDHVIRYGGDELLVLLPDVTHEQVMRKAEHLRQRLADHPVTLDGGMPIHITLSIGAATYPDHGDTQETLVSAADLGLYCAKKNGRDQARSADEGAAEAAREDRSHLSTN